MGDWAQAVQIVTENGEKGSWRSKKMEEIVILRHEPRMKRNLFVEKNAVVRLSDLFPSSTGEIQFHETSKHGFLSSVSILTFWSKENGISMHPR